MWTELLTRIRHSLSLKLPYHVPINSDIQLFILFLLFLNKSVLFRRLKERWRIFTFLGKKAFLLSHGSFGFEEIVFDMHEFHTFEAFVLLWLYIPFSRWLYLGGLIVVIWHRISAIPLIYRNRYRFFVTFRMLLVVRLVGHRVTNHHAHLIFIFEWIFHRSNQIFLLFLLLFSCLPHPVWVVRVAWLPRPHFFA